MLCLLINLSSPSRVPGSSQKGAGGLSAWSVSSSHGPRRHGMERRRSWRRSKLETSWHKSEVPVSVCGFLMRLNPNTRSSYSTKLETSWWQSAVPVSVGGFLKRRNPITRSSPSTWLLGSAFTSSLGSATSIDSAKEGPLTAAYLAQELSMK